MKRTAYTQEERMWMWLHCATGHNPILFSQVNTAYPDLEEAYALCKQRVSSAFGKWGAPFFQRLCDASGDGYLEQRIEWMHAHDVELIAGCSPGYPILLKEIRNAPPVLYVKGQLEAAPRLPIAIVGMRRSTAYGEAVARHLATELVKRGATIVSGMALGIDCEAAEGALAAEEAALPTIAVLGCGIDVIYPSENAKLYQKIVERGAVVSEFLPGAKPLREHFPIRNRVITGLSRGVVVVEAAARSGTTITANHALDQNRDVFAVPGRITDESSMGPNGMIQRGEAKPVFCVADILVEYGVSAEEQAPYAGIDLEALTPMERRIVELLMHGEKSGDEVCEILSLPVAQVNSCLTSLQFSGIIKQLPGRVFGI